MALLCYIYNNIPEAIARYCRIVTPFYKLVLHLLYPKCGGRHGSPECSRVQCPSGKGLTCLWSDGQQLSQNDIMMMKLLANAYYGS